MAAVHRLSTRGTRHFPQRQFDRFSSGVKLNADGLDASGGAHAESQRFPHYWDDRPTLLGVGGIRMTGALRQMSDCHDVLFFLQGVE
jgi:hypothetical protein